MFACNNNSTDYATPIVDDNLRSFAKSEREIDLQIVNSGCSGRDFEVKAPSQWRGELGAKLPDGQKIRLRFFGPTAAPVIAVLGGISADRFVVSEDRKKGWWPDLVGQGFAIDNTQFQIAGMDFVTGDGTVPLELTPADEADLLGYALEQAGVEKLHTFVGASFGGMVGLSFARKFPERISKLIVLCAAHRPWPLAQGWRSVQRGILKQCIESGEPKKGVALARALAMTTYRSGAEFDQRFSCNNQPNGGVDSYLKARGDAYIDVMTAASFLTLSAAIDNHFEAPEAISTPTLLIGADSDLIAPPSEIEDLARRLGGPSSVVIIPSLYGHDAFLKESDILGPHISKFIAEASSK